MAIGCYIYIASRKQYGIIKQKKTDTLFVCRVKNHSTNEFDEIEIDTINDQA